MGSLFALGPRVGGHKFPLGERGGVGLGLYEIFVHFEAVVQESTILSFPAPTCIAHPGAILLHDYWAVYDSPSDLPFVCCTPYNIGNNYRVKAKVGLGFGSG